MTGRAGLRLLLVIPAAAGCAAAAAPPPPPALEADPAQLEPLALPTERFTLPNGLTVLVHEDHRAPVVAVDIVYHVGSKDEQPGQNGLAHLVEHLMFYGTEHAPQGWFQLAAERGFTDIVGLTHNDVSRFGETVPRPALEAALWLESDRMGYLASALTQEKLDAQRQVVENEIRQNYDQPYGTVFDRIARNAYPPGHPYRWEVAGDTSQLRTLTLDDVRSWLRTFYGPNNAVLILAGAVDVATARELVTRYFAEIPPGPPVQRQHRWAAPMEGEHRDRLDARVPNPRLYRVWNIPGLGTPEYDDLRVLADVLGSGPGSRLYTRLVRELGLANNVVVWNNPKELGSSLVAEATLAAGADTLLARVDSVIQAELARLLDEGPTPAEIARALTGPRNWMLRVTEAVGGYGGRADQIGWSYVFAGRPDYFTVQQRRWARATPEQLARTGREWLRRGSYVLEVRPAPELAAAATGADRSSIPPVTGSAGLGFPQLQRATLPNGLNVVLAPRAGATMASATLVIGGGLAAESAGTSGTGAFLLELVKSASARRGAGETADLAGQLGATFSARVRSDGYLLGVVAPRVNFTRSLELLADGLLHPELGAELVEQKRVVLRANLEQELATPRLRARRALTSLLYPADHPYGLAWSGTGRPEVIEAMTPEALRAFHARWFRPNNATLVVAGDLTLAELLPLAEGIFRAWEQAPVPSFAVPPVPTPPAGAGRIFLIDNPGAAQTEIAFGFLVPPTADTSEIALEMLARLFALGASSRLNRNLREEKNWSYGAGVFRPDALGTRPFIAYAAVQVDRTAEAMQEIVREIQGLAGERPITGEELAAVRNHLTLGGPGRLQTAEAVGDAAARAPLFGLEQSYFDSYAAAVASRQGADLARSFAEGFGVAPVWVVVGDLAAIEGRLRGLGIGQVEVVPQP